MPGLMIEPDLSDSGVWCVTLGEKEHEKGCVCGGGASVCVFERERRQREGNWEKHS